MTKKAALDLCQWQHTLNFTIQLGVKKPGSMPEGTLDNGLPTRAMEKVASGQADTNSSHFLLLPVAARVRMAHQPEERRFLDPPGTRL